jgi:PAS domain S-box-containing protein
MPDAAGGELCGFYVLAHDISALKQAQRRLAASERFLEQSVAVSGVGGFQIDLHSGSQIWTRQTFKIYEMDGDAAPSAEELDKLMTPEVGATVWAAIRVASESGMGYDLEIPVKTVHGRPIWIRTIGVVEFEDGRPARVVGAIQDVTDRKQAAEALRITNERFALAADAAGIGVWEWDLSRNALRWDDQMYRLYGQTRAACEEPYTLRGKSVHVDDRARIDQEIGRALADHSRMDTEFRVTLSGGAVRHLRTAAKVQHDPSGSPIRMVGIDFDITEQKVAQLALVESEVKFRSLFELSPVGIALNDLDSGQFLSVNDALAAPTG